MRCSSFKKHQANLRAAFPGKKPGGDISADISSILNEAYAAGLQICCKRQQPEGCQAVRWQTGACHEPWASFEDALCSVASLGRQLGADAI